MEEKIYRAHVLIVPYPTQGHLNPNFQFAKRLASTGIKSTFALTNFVFKSIKPSQPSDPSLQFDTISDGYDDGGFSEAESMEAYLQKMEETGSKTIAELIVKYRNSANPIGCIVYDSFMYWVLDVAKDFGLVAASFFTQMCAVNFLYYLAHHGMLKLPISSTPVTVPGLPLMEAQDLPSFISVKGQYPAYYKMVLYQFSNSDKADFILVNSFYKLESEVVDSMSKFCPLLTIGPTIPSFYLDKRNQDDTDYDLDLFTFDKSTSLNWLNSKPERSVVFVSFGSLVCLSDKQIEELAWGLKKSTFHFLWVTRDSKETNKLPHGFVDEIGDKGLIVNWGPQLEVLSNKALGCFLTHAGWNSTIEGLSLAVPMVVMPQWTDQPTDAKFVEDIWKVGIRVRVSEDGIVGREEIERCIREVMEGERREEMKENAKKWRELAIEAVSEGGTSDKNIDEFISKFIN
ncbi:Glycosyltransferase [Melia azedarach]|uniref:Glycosyltransferase n=1 Tax=Melia azedarach TaxID=155640 RepID=A0ACC1YKX1_MELAZ|nr:Glycosyltransferase [Melia azedarach]